MGKRIIAQARGKGGPTYRAPSFRYVGEVHYPNVKEGQFYVMDIVHCQGHSAPLMLLRSPEGHTFYNVAPEGVSVGQEVYFGDNGESNKGNILSLSKIPEGTFVCNIERVPGDGGKFARTSGSAAKVVTQTEEGVVILLPSKKKKLFNPKCKATIGVVAGSGRVDKPMLKAGVAYHRARAKNKLYPRVSAASMNAVDHPFGNSRSSRKSKARPTPKNAPPGRKVGMVGARRTGRR